MGAAALTTRLSAFSTRARARAREGPQECGLCFDRPGGPLVAVCGLAGGAGTTTLAHRLAEQAARESRAPVLLTETAAEAPGLAALVGEAGSLGLFELAALLAEGERPERPFVEPAAGLRLLGSTPRRGPNANPAALTDLLSDARAAHGLVVADCGLLGASATTPLTQATHILWTVPAATLALPRAAALLASELVPPRGRAREALVARHAGRERRARVRDLRALADSRCERLVLVPDIPALARGDASDDTGRLTALMSELGTLIRGAR